LAAAESSVLLLVVLLGDHEQHVDRRDVLVDPREVL
jgi:hypothetical protein